MPLSAEPTRSRHHFFWLGLYAVLDLSWIWHDQIAYGDSGFKYDNVLAGVGCAPEQYRMAAPLAARWIASVLHVHSFTAGCIVIDLLGSLLLSYLLYTLLNQRLRTATLPMQNLARLFLGLWMLFYLHWSYGFARVETVPSCVYVVLSLLLIDKLSKSRGAALAFTAVGFLALALLQGWVRADVAVVFAVGVCMAALIPGGSPTPNRIGIFATAAVAAAFAGGSLLYLMRVVYPNAHYCCDVFSLRWNFSHDYAYIPFLTLTPPLGWGAVALSRNLRSACIADRSILFGFAMYLIVWSCMGSWGEARIIAPFAMGMLPAVCIGMASFLQSSQKTDLA
jgi:hypothetical protein